MFASEMPIGVMDSGVGGVSVLNALRFLLPFENYVYLSDSKYAPYGRRSSDEIKSIVLQNAERLVFMGCKALVVACNTATAVAVSDLRKKFRTVPVVGLEPAIRPALSYAKRCGGDVLVLATDVTVREERFQQLCRRCCSEFDAVFKFAGDNGDLNSDLTYAYALSIQNTVDHVEKKEGNSEADTEYLKTRFSLLKNRTFSAVVEGCTHFPFAEKSISDALGYRPVFFDGAQGAARRMKYLLEQNNIVRFPHNGGNGWLEWIDTGSNRLFSGTLRSFCRMGQKK